ncbi:MAG: hypothetical protein JRJ87_15885 [Deltaproteobacteria bacterium]|nr:hypothetical protein [Deltaproteobacteria bacterium]
MIGFSTKFLVAALLLLLAFSVSAKGWKGMVPGKANRKQVIEKFGEPSKEFSKGGKLSNALNYQGDEAIEGALEVNMFFDKHDVLFRIDVFPSREVNLEQVKRIFGKDYLERITKKGFTFFNYWRVGMVVFFEKDEDVVHSFMFTEPQTGSKGGKKK